MRRLRQTHGAIASAILVAGLLTNVTLGEEKRTMSTEKAKPIETAAPLPQVAVTHRLVAIDNVCAWPNLTVLRDGTLIATIFNKPAHGTMEGDVECWASADGRFWEKRGTAAPHEPSANRMNVAAGLAGNGDLLVLAGGWSLKPGEKPGQPASLVASQRPWICRSADGGRSWQVDKQTFPAPAADMKESVPFGDIIVAGDGSLRVVCYAGRRDQKGAYKVWMARSDDDGRTWKPMSCISERHNETALLLLGDGKWLAAARLEMEGVLLDLFRSDDDGKTWRQAQRLTGPGQHPGHLMRLRDGRLLLSHGNRIAGQYGALARFSADEGATWGDPTAIVSDVTGRDCGYPSSVQLPGGEILTAYYASGVVSHHRYHVGVVIWDPRKSQ